MNLEIPEGANVHIFIGHAPPLALTDQRTGLPVRSRGRRIHPLAHSVDPVAQPFD